MKRVKMALALLASALLLFSCYWTPQTGSGEFSIKFVGAPKGVGDSYARVYLLTEGNVLVPIGQDTDYAEAKISEGDTEVTVKGIPAGPRYKVLVSKGVQQAGWFEVAQYAESGLFEVSPGETQDVAVTLLDNPFTYSNRMGVSMKGVVATDEPKIYAVSASALYSGATVDAMSTAVPVTAGYTINSISRGNPEPVWVNTDKGILPYSGVFGANLPNLGAVNVLDSGIYTPLIYYQRDGGLGGAIQDEWDWLHIDLSDIVSGQPVRDFVIPNDTYGYFTTKFGALRLDRNIIGQTDPDINDYALFFEAGSNKNPILALDYKSAAPNFVMGTGDGVWTSNDPAINPSAQVSGTSGFSFYLVAASGANWAALSPYYLFIGNGSIVMVIFPFNAGLPGTVTGMIWNVDTLIISGTEGLVAITP